MHARTQLETPTHQPTTTTTTQPTTSPPPPRVPDRWAPELTGETRWVIISGILLHRWHDVIYFSSKWWEQTRVSTAAIGLTRFLHKWTSQVMADKSEQMKEGFQGGYDGCGHSPPKHYWTKLSLKINTVILYSPASKALSSSRLYFAWDNKPINQSKHKHGNMWCLLCFCPICTLRTSEKILLHTRI